MVLSLITYYSKLSIISCHQNVISFAYLAAITGNMEMVMRSVWFQRLQLAAGVAFIVGLMLLMEMVAA